MDSDGKFIVTVIVLFIAFFLGAGWMIGSANAYDSEQTHKRQMECIDRNGEFKYIPDVGKVCVKK